MVDVLYFKGCLELWQIANFKPCGIKPEPLHLLSH